MYVQMDEKTKSTKEVKKDGNMDVKKVKWMDKSKDR